MDGEQTRKFKGEASLDSRPREEKRPGIEASLSFAAWLEAKKRHAVSRSIHHISMRVLKRFY